MMPPCTGLLAKERHTFFQCKFLLIDPQVQTKEQHDRVIVKFQPPVVIKQLPVDWLSHDMKRGEGA